MCGVPDHSRVHGAQERDGQVGQDHRPGEGQNAPVLGLFVSVCEGLGDGISPRGQSFAP